MANYKTLIKRVVFNLRLLSVGTGQGFIKCSYNINDKFSTSRCSCRAAKISCSSKCHGKSEQANCTNNISSYEKEALKEAAVMSQSENENEDPRKNIRVLFRQFT
jgi:hypothetical protein